MKVLNIHKRILKQPKGEVVEVLRTLATENDLIWPKENWPKIKFKDGIEVGSKGGHGPIRYVIEQYKPDEIIKFRFLKPSGFNGIHKFEITALTDKQTEIKHSIVMRTRGKSTLKWLFIIRPLHNALLEDALDKFENNFSEQKQSTPWHLWVKFIRKQMAKK